MVHISTKIKFLALAAVLAMVPATYAEESNLLARTVESINEFQKVSALDNVASPNLRSLEEEAKKKKKTKKKKTTKKTTKKAVTTKPSVSYLFDGRFQDMTVSTLSKEYMLHIMTMRADGNTGEPANYLTITPKGRPSGYNRDTGVIDIAVDKTAQFKTQTNFRRTEIVQFIKDQSSVFIRGSLKKDTAFVNKHIWQSFFPESHSFEVRIDATQSTPQLIVHLNNSPVDSKPLVLKTWYNYGFLLDNTGVKYYHSEGDADLKLVKSVSSQDSQLSNIELHAGLLTLTSDGSAPNMPGKDKISYSGITATSKVDLSANTSA